MMSSLACQFRSSPSQLSVNVKVFNSIPFSSSSFSPSTQFTAIRNLPRLLQLSPTSLSAYGSKNPPSNLIFGLRRVEGLRFSFSSKKIVSMSASQVSTRVESVPSWETLSDIVKNSGFRLDSRLAHAKERLFGEEGEPRVTFYRDNSSWCPYCERIWLQLEEKRIPYRVEKINMRCYGPKPSWYTQMVPSGLLPAVKIDGELITESLDIMIALEKRFPEYNPLLPSSSEELKAVDSLLKLERQIFGAWLQWLTNPWGSQKNFESAMDKVDESLEQRGGPYFLGNQLSFVDIAFTPFLERIAASVPFAKGLLVRRNSRWPHVEKWYSAMDSRECYLAMKSDDFTITHTLEPQVGTIKRMPPGEAYRNLIEGKDGGWDLPLQPEVTAWGEDDGSGDGGYREEAASALIQNYDSVVSFALRGVENGDAFKEAVGLGFRHVSHAILKGVDQVGEFPSGLPVQVAVAAAYLRDRVGVPRDLRYPAARQLRAHLQWLVRSMGYDF